MVTVKPYNKNNHELTVTIASLLTINNLSFGNCKCEIFLLLFKQLKTCFFLNEIFIYLHCSRQAM